MPETWLEYRAEYDLESTTCSVAEFYEETHVVYMYRHSIMTHALGLRDIEGLGGTEVWKGGCV